MNRRLWSWLALLACAGNPALSVAATIPVVEDVMTSGFFQGANTVRGYAGEGRPVLRVSSNNAFGTGPETVYLTFSAADFASYSEPVPQAILQVEGAAGGFNADATPANPFAMSAHALTADPLTSIIDDTNPGGTISASSFFGNNILPADPAAITTVTDLGIIQFNVTAIVNDWISGANSVFAIALTGKHDTLSDGNVLHGIRNNNDSTVLGSTLISIVPEPAAAWLAVTSAVGCAAHRRGVKRSRP